jgi:adenylate cyclase class 2
MTAVTAATHIEVEIKFRVADVSALQTRLQAAGFAPVTPRTLEHNRLFDMPARTLRTRNETLRIRRYGSKWTVTHKARPAPEDTLPHKHRLETETELADGEALVSIFASLGYQVSFVYEKWRTEYSDGQGHLMLDETPIGVYAELEGSAEWIDATAARLGVTRSEYITASYARLFMDWTAATKNSAVNLTFAEVAAGAAR